jgi:hypothetical protein
MQHIRHNHVAGIFEPAGNLARRVDAPDVFPDEVAFLRFIVEQRARRQTAVLHVARQLDGIENLLIARAAADIATKTLLDFLAVGEWICTQRGGRRHHHAGNAVAALACPGLVKGLLQDAQFACLRKGFYGLDGCALRLGKRHQARLHQDAVHEHRARAAFAGTATFLVAREVEVVADEVEQPLVRPGAARDFPAIDRGIELKVRHRRPPARVSARQGQRLPAVPH